MKDKKAHFKGYRGVQILIFFFISFITFYALLFLYGVISNLNESKQDFVIYDIAVVEDEIRFILHNSMDRTAYDLEINIAQCKNSTLSDNISFLKSHDAKVIVMHCENKLLERTFESQMTVKYNLKSKEAILSHIFNTIIYSNVIMKNEIVKIKGDSCQGYVQQAIAIDGDNLFCDLNGRMWSTTISGFKSPKMYSWQTTGAISNENCLGLGENYPACDVCDNLEYAGFDDWKLPSCEVGYLGEGCLWNDFWLDACNREMGCPIDYWDSNKHDAYWSSTSMKGMNGFAYYFDVKTGEISNANKDSGEKAVRCIR